MSRLNYEKIRVDWLKIDGARKLTDFENPVLRKTFETAVQKR